MEHIRNNNNVLLVWDNSFDPTKVNVDEVKQTKNATIRFENAERLTAVSHSKSSFDVTICKAAEGELTKLYGILLSFLKPQGCLVATVPSSGVDSLKELLKLSGFVKIDETSDGLVCQKPNYEVGSATKLSFGKAAAAKASIDAAWKIDIGDDEDVVNADDLLDEDDKAKPDPIDLKVCGTTGKRKACKDCSCGLAEEFAQEGEAVTNTANAKSSCGSCYLGDAFRCASCPYMGMPAFKPGEKVQLAGGLLNDDI